MPDDRVQVQIIADSSSFQAGTKAAAEATGQLKVSAAQMAEALRQAGGDLSKVNASMLGVGEAAKTAGAALSGASAAASGAAAGVASVTPAANAATAALGDTVSMTNRARTELIVLAHEMLTGRFTRIPGSLMVMTEGMHGLGAVLSSISPAMYAAAAGAAALAGGLVAIAVGANRAAEALGTARDAFSGMDVEPSDAALGHLMDTLRLIPSATLESAQAVAHIFADMPQTSAQAAQAMADMLPEVMRRTGKDMEGAAKQMAADWSKGFKDGEAPAQAAQFFFDTYLKTVQKLSAANQDATVQALAAAGGMLGVSESLLTGEQAKVAASTQADVAAAVKATVNVYKTGADEINRAADATAKRQETLLRSAQEFGARANEVNNEFAAANERAAREASTKAIEAAREKVAAIAAIDTTSNVQRLTDQAGVWQRLLAGEKLTADATTEVRRTLNETLAELGRAQIAQATKNADEETQALRRQYEAQMEIARKGAAEIKRLNEEQMRFNKEEAEQSARDWNQAFSAINGSVSTFLSDVISKHETAAAAAKSAIDKLVTSWITGIAEIMLKIAAFEALKAASGLGGALGDIASSGASALGGSAAVAPSDAGPGSAATGLAAILPALLSRILGVGGSVTGSAVGAAGSAASTTAQTATLTADTLAQTASLTASTAAQTAALTAGQTAVTTASDTALSTAIVAGDTALGATIAGAIAAQTATELPFLIAAASPKFLGTGLAVGTASVPHDMLAMVHKGEIVVPADISASLRNPSSMTFMGASAGNVGGGGAAPTGVSGASAGGSPTVHFNISAIDGPGVSAFFNKYGTSIARTIAGVGAANPSVTAPAY